MHFLLRGPNYEGQSSCQLLDTAVSNGVIRKICEFVDESL